MKARLKCSAQTTSKIYELSQFAADDARHLVCPRSTTIGWRPSEPTIIARTFKVRL